MTDEVGVLAVKVAIIFNVQRELVGKSAVKLILEQKLQSSLLLHMHCEYLQNNMIGLKCTTKFG